MIDLSKIEKYPVIGSVTNVKKRNEDVTASVEAALHGCHPYISPYRLYLEKSGIEFPEQKDNPVFRRGRWMEPAVAEAVREQRPDWQIIKNDHYFREPDLRLGATPDFFINNDKRGLGILQTKTAAPASYDKDWEGGTTVPFWIVLQTLTECMLTNAAFGVVGVLKVDAFNPEVAIIDVPRHAQAEDKIISAVKQFWNDISNGREPGPDYGRDADLLSVVAPRAVKDKVIDLSGENELPVLLDQRAQLKAQIKSYETRCEEIETELRFKIRDGERVEGIDGWSITYKNQHRDEYVVPAKDFRVLRITDKRGSSHGQAG